MSAADYYIDVTRVDDSGAERVLRVNYPFEGAEISTGGGVQTVYSQTVTLTDAQIKAVGTPVVVIPSTETLNYSGAPTEFFLPVSAYAILDSRGGAYTNIDAAASIKLGFGSDMSADATGLARLTGSGTFQEAKVSIVPFAVPPSQYDDAFSFYGSTDPRPITDNWQDNAIVVYASNASAGAFTGGNAANSLKVVVNYIVVTL